MVPISEISARLSAQRRACDSGAGALEVEHTARERPRDPARERETAAVRETLTRRAHSALELAAPTGARQATPHKSVDPNRDCAGG